MENIKVYKMNDYEWWVSKNGVEELICWYRENIDDSFTYEEMLGEVKECNLDKEGMWWETKDIKDIEKLGDYEELISVEKVNGITRRNVSFGDLIRKGDEVYKFIPYREAIKNDLDFKEPYMIATIEW